MKKQVHCIDIVVNLTKQIKSEAIRQSKQKTLCHFVKCM